MHPMVFWLRDFDLINHHDHSECHAEYARRNGLDFVRRRNLRLHRWRGLDELGSEPNSFMVSDGTRPLLDTPVSQRFVDFVLHVS